jgi:hypothetical protein
MLAIALAGACRPCSRQGLSALLAENLKRAQRRPTFMTSSGARVPSTGCRQSGSFRSPAARCTAATAFSRIRSCSAQSLSALGRHAHGSGGATRGCAGRQDRGGLVLQHAEKDFRIVLALGDTGAADRSDRNSTDRILRLAPGKMSHCTNVRPTVMHQLRNEPKG